MTTTYYARVEYEYTGGDSIFTIPFSYIKKEHIIVLINEEITTNFVFNSESQIQINDTLTTGDKIVITRTTPLDERFVVFTNTSILNKDNQNLSAQQTFDIVQELYDSNAVFRIETEDNFEEYKEEVETEIAANKAEIEAEVAANKAELEATIDAFEITTNTTINTFKTEVNTAISNFESIVDDEIEALDTRVTTSNTKAEEAISTANTSLTTSQTAVSTANSAETKADSAISTANTANTNASTALSTADTANTNASQAVITANAADAKVDEFGEDIEVVKQAAEKIGEFEEAIETCIEAATEASASATTATTKAEQATEAAAEAIEAASGVAGSVEQITTNTNNILTLQTSKYDASNPSGFITGINSNMVTDALGYTPYNSTNPNDYQTSSQVSTTVNNAVATKQDINRPRTTLATSGTITLSDNSVNYIAPTGTVTFTLPTVSDNTKFHEILVQVNLASVQTINLGTTYFFNAEAPDLSTAGEYNLVYEYDGSNWVVGSLAKGTAS